MKSPRLCPVTMSLFSAFRDPLPLGWYDTSSGTQCTVLYKNDTVKRHDSIQFNYDMIQWYESALTGYIVHQFKTTVEKGFNIVVSKQAAVFILQGENHLRFYATEADYKFITLQIIAVICSSSETTGIDSWQIYSFLADFLWNLSRVWRILDRYSRISRHSEKISHSNRVFHFASTGNVNVSIPERDGAWLSCTVNGAEAPVPLSVLTCVQCDNSIQGNTDAARCQPALQGRDGLPGCFRRYKWSPFPLSTSFLYRTRGPGFSCLFFL